MQDELAAERPDLAISILNVNAIDVGGLDDLNAVTDLPVLQDDEAALVWDHWVAAWRDVFIVNGDNEVAGKMNLTTYSLAEPENYELLKQALIDAAGG